MASPKIYIYGRHALKEAITQAPQSVKKVHLAASMDDLALRQLITKANIPTTLLTGSNVPGDVSKDASHQGVIGVLSLDGIVREYKEFMEDFKITPHSSFLLLDELQDPHNVGAVIRSAAAFGVSAVLIPAHNQSPITGAVIKVSAGMAFRIPLVMIGNVNHTIKDLKDRGFWIYGLAGEGAQPLGKEQFTAPTVFVLGNESKGIREKTREHCDVLLSIPMHPQCESLNVAASTAIALYAWSVQHQTALAIPSAAPKK